MFEPSELKGMLQLLDYEWNATLPQEYGTLISLMHKQNVGHLKEELCCSVSA